MFVRPPSAASEDALDAAGSASAREGAGAGLFMRTSRRRVTAWLRNTGCQPFGFAAAAAAAAAAAGFPLC